MLNFYLRESIMKKKLPNSPDYNLIIHIKKREGGAHVLKEFYDNLPNCSLIIYVFKSNFPCLLGLLADFNGIYSRQAYLIPGS